jgi:hypothetical protein
MDGEIVEQGPIKIDFGSSKLSTTANLNLDVRSAKSNNIWTDWPVYVGWYIIGSELVALAL